MQPKLIQSFELSKLTGNKDNPRLISPEARDALKRNLQRHGNVGVLVARKLPDGTHRLVSGHQRLSVLQDAGERKAPVYVVECSDQDEKHMMVTLNGHAGTWDNTKLADLIEELEEAGEKVEDLGVSQADLDRLMQQVEDGDGGSAKSPTGETQDTGEAGEPAPAEARPNRGLGTPIIHYDIVFDTEDQQALWFKFLRYLKETYTKEETIGARATRYLAEQGFIIENSDG